MSNTSETVLSTSLMIAGLVGIGASLYWMWPPLAGLYASVLVLKVGQMLTTK